MAKKLKRTLPPLIENSVIVTGESCRWCDALDEPHSRCCPLGERYKQVQQLGGVPVPEGVSIKDFFA